MLAKTDADEKRLLAWLARSTIVGESPQKIADALNDLEGVE